MRKFVGHYLLKSAPKDWSETSKIAQRVCDWADANMIQLEIWQEDSDGMTYAKIVTVARTVQECKADVREAKAQLRDAFGTVEMKLEMC